MSEEEDKKARQREATRRWREAHPDHKPAKRVITEEQRERNRQRERDRWANKTPEQKRAQIEREHASRSPEQRRQRAEQQQVKALYTPHEDVTEHTSDQILKALGGVLVPVYRQQDRGFALWKPQAESVKLLGEVQEILEEYQEQLPLTNRQVLYRMMGKFNYEKKIEVPLYQLMRRARRAHVIPMDAIRDDGGVQEEPQFWDDADQWIDATRNEAQDVRLDRQDGQKKRLVVHCEAGGMVPQLARVANPYGVPVISSGGFDSITEKHEFGRDRDDVEVLCLVDDDPSGLWQFISMAEDMSAFAVYYGNSIEFTLIAVTPEQIESLGLETQSVNPDDERAFPRKRTCQVEAIPPDELARIVREAIESRMDMRVYRRVLKAEKALHEELDERLENA